MAIKFDRPTNEELLEDLEIHEALTICKLRYQFRGNSLFMHIPYIFPDYKNLIPKQQIYFLDLNNTIYLYLTEPKIKNYISRTIQWYGNNNKTTTHYIRVPIPVQLRKKYNLDHFTKAHLVKKENYYECIFV